MNALGRLSAKDRRALFLGVAILTPALTFTFVGRPYLRARAALVDQVREQRDLLGRELVLLRSAPHRSADLANASQTLAATLPRLFPARDPLAATALLVNAVSESARRQGIAVETIESRPAESVTDGLVAVQVNLQGRGDLEGLLRWLDALETGARLLRIEELSVVRAGPEPSSDSLDVETLGFAATIRGYLLATWDSDTAAVPVASVGGRP